MLAGSKIVLGITGGIAAYKAAGLTRLLVKQGATVKVIMTATFFSEGASNLCGGAFAKRRVRARPPLPTVPEWPPG